MSYLDLSIEEIHKALVTKQVLPSELVSEAYDRAQKYQKDLNAFVSFRIQALKEAQNLDGKEITNPLFGIPYAMKDNYSVKGELSTGSSNILKDYYPVYDATVVKKLKEAGAVSIGKTVLDELGLGGTGTNGNTGVVKNPWAIERISGGSSAGSAVAVSAGIVPFAIGSDTGDSVRKPAAYCGCVGFKPSWGRISRFGLFPFATSLDHVAYFTRTVKDAAYLLENLAGKDPKDMTCSIKPVEQYVEKLNPELKGKKLAIIKSINESLGNPLVRTNFEQVLLKLKEAGVEIIEEDIDMRLLKAIYPIYMVISSSEATSNNANLDGIKFGPREKGTDFLDSIIKTRTVGFSELVKRRFVFGGYCLAKENQKELLIRAQKIRRLIVNEVQRILAKCEAIFLPATGSIAPKFTEKNDEKLSVAYLIGENHLAIGNFAGLPSLTLPSGFVDDLPVGVNVMGKAFKEQEVLNISLGIETLLARYKGQIAKRGGE